jgi:hypothetical protein
MGFTFGSFGVLGLTPDDSGLEQNDPNHLDISWRRVRLVVLQASGCASGFNAFEKIEIASLR